MSDNVRLESRFYVEKILKSNTLTRELDLCAGCIIEVSMILGHRKKDGTSDSYARYIDVFNICNGKEKKHLSLNLFTKMISENFVLMNY